MYQIYQINPNDTLVGIAQKYNTTIDELRRINGMNLNYMLSSGNYIVIPNSQSSVYQTYTVEKGDNLYQIASRYGTTVQNLLLINGLEDSGYIYPGQQILIPNEDINVYVTEEETLESVSSKSGVSIQDLLEQNKMIYLMPDQIIVYKKRENM